MESKPEYWRQRARCSPTVVVGFYRELATLLASGISIVDALQVSIDYSSDDTMPLVAAELQQMVSSGYPLSIAMEQFPRIFSNLSVALVRLGEDGGSLINQLQQLCIWMERDNKLRRQVVSALTYPAFALVITVILTLILFLSVVPDFMLMFDEMGIELPLPTKVLSFLTLWITNPTTWAILSVISLIALYLSRSTLETEQGQAAVYGFALKLPVFGTLLRDCATARFAFAASTMLRSGGNLLNGLRLSARASGSPLMAQDSAAIVRALGDGLSLSEHMSKHTHIYPKLCAQLTAVGEEAAKLPEMFTCMAEHYESELEYQIRLATALLEPILMGSVAFVVGSVVMAVFLPMYGFISQIQ